MKRLLLSLFAPIDVEAPVGSRLMIIVMIALLVGGLLSIFLPAFAFVAFILLAAMLIYVFRDPTKPKD